MLEDQARSIFLAALDRAHDQWPAHLDEACGADAALRARVEELLQAHQKMGTIQPAGVDDARIGTLDEPAQTERPGTVIGPYKLLEQIGEGGMGTVWMAQQTEPVKRVVALKLIKAGMDSKQVIARFEAERQALALMDHANIARVLDAGTTGAGRPYFVMDFVKGVPITRYCDEHHLTPRQRLELFIPVCQAVQHAHQKGIIHRDLKPSNVLVAPCDGKPVPKVIDFGVAKAAGQSLTDKTLVTGFGNIVGTLEYMSPEQAEINQLDIDTRSDIYSLGVLLYELLAGSPPFTKKDLEKAGILEMLRVIREQEPSKPSTKLSTAEGLPTLAANRGTEPAKLTRLVRGELDWIVMKALEKDRNRRYETANGFAMDVQRYLADEPVLAGPPTAWYRFRKFARRNRMVLTMALLIGVSLLAGTAISTWQAIRATDAEKLAEDRRIAEGKARDELEAASKEQENKRSRVNSELSSALVETLRLRGLVKTAGPGTADHATRLRELSSRAETLASNELADPSLVRQVQTLLLELRQDDANRRMVARLEDIRLKAVGLPRIVNDPASPYAKAFEEYGLPLSELTVDEAVRRIAASPIRDALVAALDDWVRNSATESGKRTLAICKQVYTDKEPWLRQYFEARYNFDGPTLARLARAPETADRPPGIVIQLAKLSDLPTAIALLRKAQRKHPGDVVLNYYLADRLRQPGSKSNQEEIFGFCRAALAARPESLLLREEVVACHLHSGKYEVAVEFYEELIQLNPDDPKGYTGLGMVHMYKKDYATAVTYMSKALERDPKSEDQYISLWSALRLKGDLDTAITILLKGLDINPASYRILLGLAQTAREKGEPERAIPACRKSAQFAKSDRRYHGTLQVAFQSWAELLKAKGELEIALTQTKDQSAQLAKSEPLYREFLEKAREQFGADHPQTAGALAMLGLNLLQQKQWAEAEKVLRDSLKIREKTQPDEWNTFNTQSMLGGALLGQKKYPDAEPLLLKGYEGMKQREARMPLAPGVHQRAAVQRLVALHHGEAVQRLVTLYEATGNADAAAKWRNELRLWKK
jgi:serine/threonine protein kinase/tetratricopeptide (TPR) repeat protein